MSTISSRPPARTARAASASTAPGSGMWCSTSASSATSSSPSSIGRASRSPSRRSTFVRPPSRSRASGEHLARVVDRDDAAHERRERLGRRAGAASEVSDDERVVEERQEREQVGTRTEQLHPQAVPRVRRRREEGPRGGSALGEHGAEALRIVRGARQRGDAVAHRAPQPARGARAGAGQQPVATARAVRARIDPTGVHQRLQVTAGGRLRQLQRRRQLPDRQLVALEGEQEATAYRVGQGGERVDDLHEGAREPFIRISG